ncbi:MAG: HAMP domain-containing histidine kinase [Ignavibacteria bacterium]|nr:HAMP domain-containing histidine kinase [Ignavibacteria bacterium]
MIPLIPNWAQHYGEFWRAIRTRNLWFIKLRYLAAPTLLGFVIVGQYLLNFQLTSIQFYSLVIISLFILIYNIIIHKTRKYVGCIPDKFNCLHLSLIQMGLDLISLMFVVYYTGLIESPLHLFFIFHMIIGSLILPGYLVYITAGIISFIFGLLAMMQRYEIVERYFINGLYINIRPHTLTYDIIFIIIFTMMLFVSVYIANKISHQLYRREQQLRSTIEKLNEAEIKKQKYIMGIVHEVKTPVTATHSILDLIIKKYIGPITSEVEIKLHRAIQRTEETLNLLNDILRISRLKILDLKTAEDVDIHQIFESLIDKQLELIRTKSITLDFNDRRQENKKIKSDLVLLELAISNLISNAIKYVDQNGVIEIIIDDKDGMLYIEFSDNGIGIPKESLPKIFTQFYRANNVDKVKHSGTGMGLAIVKEIIERFGGKITVNSPSRIGNEQYPGTTFEIFLPYNFKRSEYDIFEVNDEEYLSNKSNF